MTLEEAIKYSTQLNPLFETWLHKDFEKAHKLSIEAMKSITLSRLSFLNTDTRLLPGETKQPASPQTLENDPDI